MEVGRGVLGFVLWKACTFRCACSRLSAVSQVASSLGYPFHFTKYSNRPVRLPRLVFKRLSITSSTSNSSFLFEWSSSFRCFHSFSCLCCLGKTAGLCSLSRTSLNTLYTFHDAGILTLYAAPPTFSITSYGPTNFPSNFFVARSVGRFCALR